MLSEGEQEEIDTQFVIEHNPIEISCDVMKVKKSSIVVRNDVYFNEIPLE